MCPGKPLGKETIPIFKYKRILEENAKALYSCLNLATINQTKDMNTGSKVWEGKLKQRTYTYLKLDELQRDFRYEGTLEEEALEKNVQRFKEILYADNTYCEKNTELAIDHLDTLHDNQSSK